MMATTANESQFHQGPLGSSCNNQEWVVGGRNELGGDNNKEVRRRARRVSNAMKTINNWRQLTLSQDSTLPTFLAESSIHGVKYISQQDRHWTERFFWVVAFLLGVSSTVYLVHGVWDRYHQSPVIFTFDVNPIDTNSIPFPAVTICNGNLISRRLVNGLERTLEETNSSDPKHIEAQARLQFLRWMCPREPEANISRGLIGGSVQYGKLEDVIGSLINNTDACDQIITTCLFNGNPSLCTSLFRPVITSLGKCCTFNLLPLGLLLERNQSGNRNGDLVDHGNANIDKFVEAQYFSKPEGVEVWSKWQPQKQQGAGISNGLSIWIDSKLDDYYCPSVDSEGVLFTLHSPFEMPLSRNFVSLIHLGKKTLFEVSADVTKADPDIMDYTQKKRKCYFANEKHLKFHRPYTRSNCIAECKADYFANQCGCTPFYIPNYHPEHKGKGICSPDFSADNKGCIREAELLLDDSLDAICPGCDPLCEEIKYTHQMSMAKLLSKDSYLKGNQRTTRNSLDTLAAVDIFFGSERTIPKIRTALYGWTDLIANIGGILGLCLGFSVISGIELVYFFSLRTLCKKREPAAEEKEEGSVNISLSHMFRSRSNTINPSSCQPTEEGIANAV